MIRPAVIALVAVAALAAAHPAAAHTGGKAEPRIAAGVSEGPGLDRTITVELEDLDGGGPISGATVTARASMTRPHVMRAAPWRLVESRPGVYEAPVRFLMPAEWTIDVRVTGEDVVQASSSLPVEIVRGGEEAVGAGAAGEPPPGVTLLPTQLEDVVAGTDVATMIVLWLHGIASIGWIGGVLVMAVALSARPGVLAEGLRTRLAAGYRRWGAALHFGFVPVVVMTGVYNMLYVTPFPLAWKPDQLAALADVPYGPLYEAILAVKLGLFVALLVTGTQVLLRTVRPVEGPAPAELGPVRTLRAILGAPGIVYVACMPLILGAVVALRYVHVLSHVADVVANG